MYSLLATELNSFASSVNRRSNRVMSVCLIIYFIVGLAFAMVYDTWFIAISIGGLCLAVYHLAKWLLPESNFYQYVLSLVTGIFMAQFIFQMHGMFEMHFFAFIGSALLITYQNWRLQLPLAAFVFVHHFAFAFLQNAGYKGIYFTQLNYFEWQTFIIHILLAVTIFLISGLWAFQLKKATETQIAQSLEVADLRKEAILAAERSKLNDISWMQSHVVRAPLCSIMALIPMIQETTDEAEQQQLLEYLSTSAKDLDSVIHAINERSKPEVATELM